MKKVLSLITVPVLAVSMFLGCSKTEYTSEQVNARFDTFMDSYIDIDHNEVFKYNVVNASSEFDEEKLLESTQEANNYIYEKIMYITYDDAYNLDTVVNNSSAPVTLDQSLRIKYDQLKSVYQKMLSLTFNYYANWQDNFYEHASGKVTSEEMEKLLDRLNDLQAQVNEFLEEKDKIELEAKSRSAGSENGLNSSIMSSLLNKFNYEYSMLLEKSFSFVNYFKNLHQKYNFSTQTVNVSSAKRLLDASVLKLAQAMYYDMVKAFETTSEVELDKLVSDYGGVAYNLFQNSGWQNVVAINDSVDVLFQPLLSQTVDIEMSITIEDALLNVDNVVATDLVNEAENRVSVLYSINTMFDKEFAIYKKAFNNTSMTDYNLKRGLASGQDNYDNLSLEQQGDIDILLNFNSITVPLLINAINGVMNLYL